VFGGNIKTTNINDISGITIGTMSFANNGTTGSTSAFTLSGSALAFSNSTLILSATTAGSAITDSVANALTLTGSNTASFGSGHSMTISGNISGGGSLTKSGVGSLFLTGSNSQSGTVYITGGNVRTGGGAAATDSNNFALGTGDVVVSGSGSLAVRNNSIVSNNLRIGGVGTTANGEFYGPLIGSFQGSGQRAVVSGSVTLTSDATISTWANTGTGSKLTLSGTVDIGSNVLTLTRRVTGSGTTSTSTEISGPIVGAGSVVVNGSATVYLNGVNTYTGSTTIQSGTFGGNGTIVGAVVVQNGAMLTPGSDANTTGALHVGSLQLDSGATAAMAISGTSSGLYDQVVATGDVHYGGTLAINFTSGGFSDGAVWQLFSGASHSGHFTTVTGSGAYGNLTFNYQAGEWKATGGTLGAGESLSFYEDNTHAYGDRFKAGQLVLVPEPSTIVCAGIGLLVVGWRRWSQRRTIRRSTRATSAN